MGLTIIELKNLELLNNPIKKDYDLVSRGKSE